MVFFSGTPRSYGYNYYEMILVVRDVVGVHISNQHFEAYTILQNAYLLLYVPSIVELNFNASTYADIILTKCLQSDKKV